ncbi:MAG: hypothetical protein MR355_05275 [Lachnospiraceae bacterium]|nr:hypothetical protein [Lachnospiraceae bacterium]
MKNYHKSVKRIVPVVLSVALVAGAATPVKTTETPSEKEEVIYINLTGEGAVKDVYAVNIFGSGDITTLKTVRWCG